MGKKRKKKRGNKGKQPVKPPALQAQSQASEAQAAALPEPARRGGVAAAANEAARRRHREEEEEEEEADDEDEDPGWQAKLDALTTLGFSEAAAAKALRQYPHSLGAAANWLISEEAVDDDVDNVGGDWGGGVPYRPEEEDDESECADYEVVPVRHNRQRKKGTRPTNTSFAKGAKRRGSSPKTTGGFDALFGSSSSSSSRSSSDNEGSDEDEIWSEVVAERSAANTSKATGKHVKTVASATASASGGNLQRQPAQQQTTLDNLRTKVPKAADQEEAVKLERQAARAKKRREKRRRQKQRKKEREKEDTAAMAAVAGAVARTLKAEAAAAAAAHAPRGEGASAASILAHFESAAAPSHHAGTAKTASRSTARATDSAGATKQQASKTPSTGRKPTPPQAFRDFFDEQWHTPMYEFGDCDSEPVVEMLAFAEEPITWAGGEDVLADIDDLPELGEDDPNNAGVGKGTDDYKPQRQTSRKTGRRKQRNLPRNTNIRLVSEPECGFSTVWDDAVAPATWTWDHSACTEVATAASNSFQASLSKMFPNADPDPFCAATKAKNRASGGQPLKSADGGGGIATKSKPDDVEDAGHAKKRAHISGSRDDRARIRGEGVLGIDYFGEADVDDNDSDEVSGDDVVYEFHVDWANNHAAFSMFAMPNHEASLRRDKSLGRTRGPDGEYDTYDDDDDDDDDVRYRDFDEYTDEEDISRDDYDEDDVSHDDFDDEELHDDNCHNDDDDDDDEEDEDDDDDNDDDDDAPTLSQVVVPMPTPAAISPLPVNSGAIPRAASPVPVPRSWPGAAPTPAARSSSSVAATPTPAAVVPVPSGSTPLPAWARPTTPNAAQLNGGNSGAPPSVLKSAATPRPGASEAPVVATALPAFSQSLLVEQQRLSGTKVHGTTVDTSKPSSGGGSPGSAARSRVAGPSNIMAFEWHNGTFRRGQLRAQEPLPHGEPGARSTTVCLFPTRTHVGPASAPPAGAQTPSELWIPDDVPTLQQQLLKVQEMYNDLALKLFALGHNLEQDPR